MEEFVAYVGGGALLYFMFRPKINRLLTEFKRMKAADERDRQR